MIAIEVCTRETLRYLVIDAYCISCSTDTGLCFLVPVVHCQFWDLEDSTMWMANQYNPLTITVIGCIDLIVFQRIDWKDHMVRSTRKSSRFEMYSRSICIISEGFQQTLTNRRIGELGDLFELLTLPFSCDIQLGLGE